MNEPKFTPGPWRVDVCCADWKTDSHLLVADDNENDIVIQIAKTYERETQNPHAPLPKEASANANLLSAAPDLYAALKAFLKWHDAPLNTASFPPCAAAIAALAKARGEPEPVKLEELCRS